MKKIIVRGSLLEFFKKYRVALPYLGIFIVLASSFRIYQSGDDQALLNGLNYALSCFSATPIRFPCGAGVVHFPIYQYLIGAPFKLSGFSDSSVKEIFGLMNGVFSVLAGAAFWRAGSILPGKAGGHLSLLVLLSGYLVWYMTSTFNEATSFTLFALLALSVIDHWQMKYVFCIALLCTITKEIAFPFALYFMFLSYWARELKTGQAATLIRRVSQFIIYYKLAILGVVTGIAINLLFNYFRFGSVKNLSNLDPILFTPIKYIPDFFSYLLISPAGGLVFTWLSLCILLIVPIVFLRRDHSNIFIIGFALLGLIVANLGFARWYSPFGWCAWGPRLTLPFLGAIGILGVYLVVPQVIQYFQTERRKSGIIIIFMVIAASSLPNIAVRLDGGAFFSKMYAPTKVEIDSGIQNFTVQSAPAPLYQKASSEAYARNVVIPTTMRVALDNWAVVLLWLCSIFYISRQIFILKQDSNRITRISDPDTLYSNRYVVHVSADVNGRIISIGLTRILALTLVALFLLIGSILHTRTHREACSACFDSMQKFGLGETTAKYSLSLPQEILVKGLENFPAALPLASIQIELKDPANLKAVSISAFNQLGNDLGNWTTQPVSHLWGIGIIDNESVGKIRNNGQRTENLNLPIKQKLTLLIPDNGNLSKCPQLYIQLFYGNGKRVSSLAECKSGAE